MNTYRYWQQHPYPQLAHTRMVYSAAEYRREAAPYLAKTRLNGAEHHRFAHILCAEDHESTQQAHYVQHLCAAARLGNPAALYDLAHFFQHGLEGLPQNHTLAARLLSLSLKKHYPHALCEMAQRCLFQTHETERGLAYLRQATAGRSQEALLLLADFHARGRFGFPRSRRLATFYKKQAWRDDVLGC